MVKLSNLAYRFYGRVDVNDLRLDDTCIVKLKSFSIVICTDDEFHLFCTVYWEKVDVLKVFNCEKQKFSHLLPQRPENTMLGMYQCRPLIN